MGAFNKTYAFTGINVKPDAGVLKHCDMEFVPAREIRGNEAALRAQEYMLTFLDNIKNKPPIDIQVPRARPKRGAVGRGMKPIHHQTIGRSVLHGQTLGERY